MAVDFGLVNQGAYLPMSVDPIGQASNLYTLAGQQRKDVAETQAQQRQQSDHAVLTEAMKSPDFDLHTPDGVKSALAGLRGKISPEGYMELEGHATKVMQADTQLRHAIHQMTSDQRAAALQTTEQVMPLLETALTRYKEVAAAKGEQAAKAELSPLAAQLQGMGPAINPSLVQALNAGDVPALTGMLRSSAYKKSILTAAELEARADKERAVAKAMESGEGKTPPQAATDPATGTKYVIPAHKKWALRMNADGTQDQISIGELPASLSPLVSAKNAQGGGSSTFDAEKDLEERPATKDEIFAAKHWILNKEMPSYGSGGAAARKKMRIMAIAPQVAEEMGMGAEEVTQLQKKIKAAGEATKRLLTQSTNIRGGEKNVLKVIGILEDEVKRLGGPDSPKMRKFWNTAMTKWSGEPDFVGVNQAYLDLIENMARVYSGVTSASGTPVSFLELAKGSLPDNPSLAQVMELRRTVPKLFKARLDATQSELDDLLKTPSLPTGGKKSPAQAPTHGGETVPPEKQTALDAKAGEQEAINKYRGDVNAAKADLAKYDAALKSAKGEERSFIQADRDRVAAAISHMEKKQAPAAAEGARSKSKSGKDIIFRNGKWEYL